MEKNDKAKAISKGLESKNTTSEAKSGVVVGFASLFFNKCMLEWDIVKTINVLIW